MTYLFRVTAPHYCAGLILDENGKCIQAAPILGWTRGKTADFLLPYFERKGFTVEVCG